jgi:hypothetical protein
MSGIQEYEVSHYTLMLIIYKKIHILEILKENLLFQWKLASPKIIATTTTSAE